MPVFHSHRLMKMIFWVTEPASGTETVFLGALVGQDGNVMEYLPTLPFGLDPANREWRRLSSG